MDCAGSVFFLSHSGGRDICRNSYAHTSILYIEAGGVWLSESLVGMRAVFDGELALICCLDGPEVTR